MRGQSPAALPLPVDHRTRPILTCSFSDTSTTCDFRPLSTMGVPCGCCG
ncbi:unnamed protein product [Ectocarpus sp. 13 AM-2016]